MIVAHVAGVPVEETISSRAAGAALVTALGAVAARFRARRVEQSLDPIRFAGVTAG